VRSWPDGLVIPLPKALPRPHRRWRRPWPTPWPLPHAPASPASAPWPRSPLPWSRWVH